MGAALWVVVGISLVVGWRRVFRFIGAYLHRHRRFPAAYALVLLKEGPKEPTAEEMPPPFTEPLDDP